MSGGHFGTPGLSPYTRDHQRESFYRAEEEARRIRDRTTRAQLWLTERLDGQRFQSEDQMRFAVLELATTLGYVMDDETAHVITSATTLLWQTGRYLAPAVAA
jgi:hypothetical protein